MKGSEILKMVEDVLPGHINVESYQGINMVTVRDKVPDGLDLGEYGVVNLSLVVRLDAPVCDTGNDVDMSRFEAMRIALETIRRWATTLEMSGIVDLAERGLHGKNRTSDMPEVDNRG